MKMTPNAQTAAICGLFCGTCPNYPENCHGCLSSKLTSECTICPVGFRTCAAEHKVERCYECGEFPCARIEEFSHQHIECGICHHENIITDLNAMRTRGVDTWVAEQTQAHTCPKCGELIYWHERDSHKCK